MKRHKYFKKEVREVKKAIREAVLVFKIITYLAAWLLVILILYKQSTPAAALVGIGLYIISTLAIVKGGGVGV